MLFWDSTKTKKPTPPGICLPGGVMFSSDFVKAIRCYLLRFVSAASNKALA